MSNLWSGRFDTAPDAETFEFGSSFRFDRRLFEDDVTGSIAWARALGAAGVLDAGEARQIEGVLSEILERGRTDPLFVDGPDEDVHSFVERLLVERLGDAGRRLQPRMIAPQRRGVGQEKMRDEHRLRRPEVRERRHQGVPRRRRLRRERGDDASDAALQERQASQQVEPQIHRHLLVARAPGVQAAPCVTKTLDEQPLDEAVDVLVRSVHE